MVTGFSKDPGDLIEEANSKYSKHLFRIQFYIIVIFIFS